MPIWEEGTQLMIDEMKRDDVEVEPTGWFEDMDAHASEVDDDDIAAINAALAVAKAEQKQLVPKLPFPSHGGGVE